jgi:hypothetical protein
MQFAAGGSRSPVLERLVAGLGLAWNAFGAWQFLGSVSNTAESFERMGMTAGQAATMAAVPGWMHAGFAVGVAGGLIGSAMLFFRLRAAAAVFAASLLGYIVLFIGDVTQGVFAALGASQVVVLITVLAVAGALLAQSLRVNRAAERTVASGLR